MPWPTAYALRNQSNMLFKTCFELCRGFETIQQIFFFTLLSTVWRPATRALVMPRHFTGLCQSLLHLALWATTKKIENGTICMCSQFTPGTNWWILILESTCPLPGNSRATISTIRNNGRIHEILEVCYLCSWLEPQIYTSRCKAACIHWKGCRGRHQNIDLPALGQEFRQATEQTQFFCLGPGI